MGPRSCYGPPKNSDRIATEIHPNWGTSGVYVQRKLSIGNVYVRTLPKETGIAEINTSDNSDTDHETQQWQA
jgi:hypothetical protein